MSILLRARHIALGGGTSVSLGGRCGKERPAEMGGAGRKAATAREEVSSLHHRRRKFPESLERNGRAAVLTEYVRLSALVLRIGDFDRVAGLKASGKSSPIGKLNLDVRAVVVVLKDGEDAYDFAGEFFAFNHGLAFSRGEDHTHSK